jgi:putative hydroxymethylpyrimidine transport system substrate-binding protein
MNRPHRIIHALVALLILLASVGVVACGSDDDGGGGGDGEASAGQKLTPVEFQLSWLPGGDNLWAWAGKAQGFFEEEGIDLQIKHSNDPTASIKLAASGERPMAIAYTGDIIISASKGQKVVSIWALTDRSPFGLISIDSEGGIKSPKDLEGKRVGVTSLPIDQAFFDNMLAEAGVDKDKVKIVDPSQSGIQQVIQGNIDATSAVVEYEPVVLENKGIDDYTFLYYSDYGAPDAPFYSVVANPDWLSEPKNQEIARGFVRAIRKSVKWTDENTDEAAELLTEEFPEQDPELNAAIWRAEMRIHGDGSHDPSKYQGLTDFLEERDFLDGPVDIKEIQTNEYQ